MDIPSSIAIIALAALIHASFQLSTSMLTLLSSHTIGHQRSHARLLRMTCSFITGASIMTMLLLSFSSLILLSIFGSSTPLIAWAIACGMSVGIAIAVWLFYYRNESGTTLWIPRGIARYLTDRTKATHLSGEAFGLGLSSVIGEILFIITPLGISALILIQLPPMWQLAGIGIYTLISSLSLIIVLVLIGSGHAISGIQQWRESNKRFLQFVGGAGLITLALFVYVSAILGNLTGAI